MLITTDTLELEFMNQPTNHGAATNRRPAGQSDGSGNLFATVAADPAHCWTVNLSRTQVRIADLFSFDRTTMLKHLLSLFCLFGTIVTETHAAGAGSKTDSKSYPVLSGLGLALKVEQGHILVGGIIPKSPADQSGKIPAGARLVSVTASGKETLLDGKSVGEAADLIRGPVGTKVVLTVLPPKAQEPYQVTLERAPLELAGVPDSSYAAFIGKPAPDLALSALETAEASRLSDYRGKIVVLDFWASWCPTCFPPVTKMQTLAKRHQAWQDKVELIAVTVDADLSQARAAIKKQAWHDTRHCAVAFDDLKRLGVSVVPLVIIIAPDGTIAAMAGAQAIDVEKEVQSLLAK